MWRYLVLIPILACSTGPFARARADTDAGQPCAAVAIPGPGDDPLALDSAALSRCLPGFAIGRAEAFDYRLALARGAPAAAIAPLSRAGAQRALAEVRESPGTFDEETAAYRRAFHLARLADSLQADPGARFAAGRAAFVLAERDLSVAEEQRSCEGARQAAALYVIARRGGLIEVLEAPEQRAALERAFDEGLERARALCPIRAR